MTDDEFLEANHYTIKYSDSIGYWVDGRCGYAVTSYCDDFDIVVQLARMQIEYAFANKESPVWFFTQFDMKGEYKYYVR